MGFDDGKVTLDNASGAYYGGQTIIGTLTFNMNKGKTIHGIYVEVKGFCKVHWTTERYGYFSRFSYTVNHDSHEQYIRRKTFVCGAGSGEYRLQPGQHVFRFDCPIPVNCPSSFEGVYGHIRYCFKIVMLTTGIFSRNKEKIVPFQIYALLDLNRNPYCSRPIEFQLDDSYTCWCISVGYSQVLVKLPLGGYCPGQVIPIEVTCKNESTVKIKKIVFTIKKVTQLIALSDPGIRKTKKNLAQIKTGPIPAQTTRNWIVEFQVPTEGIYNVNACNFIKINYFFKVSTKISGCHSGISQTHPIVLGTIPLHGIQNPPNGPLQGTNCYPPSPVLNQPLPTNSPYPGGNPGFSPNQGSIDIRYGAASASYPLPMGGLYPTDPPPSYSHAIASTSVGHTVENAAGFEEKKH